MADVKTNGRCVHTRSEFETELLKSIDGLKRFAVKLTHSVSKAEDLVQETCVRALSKQDQFTHGTSMKAWLFTILRNELYSQFRKSTREQPIDSAVIERAAAPRSDQQWEDEQEVAHEFLDVAPFLACIPQEMSDSVIAIHYLDLQYEEAASILSIRIGTVKSRVNRGLEAVRNLMETEEITSFDLSSWATAALHIPEKHIYFPIAKAYEDMYAFLTSSSNHFVQRSRMAKKPVESDADAQWRKLKESGALDEKLENFEELIFE